jgi:hypothetical protein
MIDLSAVPEDEDAEEDAEEDNNIDSNLLESEGFQEPDHSNLDTSPGRASAVSGTTSKTTFSQEEIVELDPDVMLDSLKKLNDASDDLLDSLVPSGPMNLENLLKILSDITTPEDTRESKLYHKMYQKRLAAFMLYKSDFMTAQANEFIRPQNVSRALFAVASVEDIPEGATRPDSIMYKANLANMLRMILVKTREVEAATIPEILESVNQAFPTLVAGGEYNPLAVNLSIALTMQLALNRIQDSANDTNFDPQRIVSDAFFSQEDNGSLRHYDALHLRSAPEQQEKAAFDRIHSIVNGIKETFDVSSETDSTIAVETLREAYKWDTFFEVDIIPYMVERKHTLDYEIQMAGGINKLDHDVKQSVKNKEELKSLSGTRAMLEQARQRPDTSRGNPTSAAQYLRALSHPAGPSQQGVAPTAQMTAPAPTSGGQQAGGYPQFYLPGGSAHDPALSGSDLHDLSAFQSIDKTHTASAAKGKGKGRGKAKSFNERQAGAERVPWDGSQDRQDLVNYVLPNNNSVLGKRIRDGEDENFEVTQDRGLQEDEDDAFQTHSVDDAAADARRLQAPSATRSARPSLSQPLHLRSEYDGQQPAPKRRNPGSRIPSAAEYPSSINQPSPQRPHPNPHIAPASTALAQEYQQAAWTARHMRTMSQPKPARERRAWSDMETEALMTYINEWPEEDNLHYAAMKRKDEAEGGHQALQGRTAEDIRFRARNMKVNFLLSRFEMHPNWMKVQLAKKEIDKLNSRGVLYNQAAVRAVGSTGEMPPPPTQFGEQNE